MRIMPAIYLSFVCSLLWGFSCYIFKIGTPWAGFIGMLIGSAAMNFGLYWWNRR